MIEKLDRKIIALFIGYSRRLGISMRMPGAALARQPFWDERDWRGTNAERKRGRSLFLAVS
jgi:hypothetical protein